MKQYQVKKIRNVALLGHGGDGKTTLAEAMLYTAGETDRFGRISDGTTVSDFDPEEIKRKFSISSTVLPIEWKGVKINLLDTPGYFDFAGEVCGALRVVDGAVILVTGKSGVQVGTEKAWNYCKKLSKAKMFFISKIDEEHSDFYKVIEQLRQTFGTSICPVEIPMFEDEKAIGYINLIDMKAIRYEKGKPVEVPIHESLNKRVDPCRKMIDEAVAETSEENMEKYFMGESFSREEIIAALKIGVSNGDVTPVLCGSASELFGIEDAMNIISDFFPSPDELPVVGAHDEDGNDMSVKRDQADPTSVIVFKTIADPFVGKMSYFKVVSGEMKSDMTLFNPRTGSAEKIGKLYYSRGKKTIETDSIGVGDIGFVSKLGGTKTGDTLCASERHVVLQGVEFPKPTYSLAIEPKSKGDEEKISQGLRKLEDEDPTFKFSINKETRQQVISGLGDNHLDVIVSKLATKFGTSVNLSEPIVAYRETIRKKVKVQGRHKKQSGGHGQFGDVWIEFEPGTEEGLVFETNVFGGSVPKNFFPAVEKGLQDCVGKGVLAAYPVVNLKATLVDGSYHPVDSSEMAFKVAASLAYKAGMAQANPVLLEPIGSVNVYVPDSYMGDVIGDINKRRGRILGMTPYGEGLQRVEAEAPMSEMMSYAIDLRSMTGGRGSFDIEFARYEEAPSIVAQKVIADRKDMLSSDDDE